MARHSLTAKAIQQGHDNPLPLIVEAIIASDGNISEARRTLGVSASTMSHWLPKLKIDRKVTVTVEILPESQP